MDIEEHFSKQFSFTQRTNKDGSVNWVLPPADRMYTSPVWKVGKGFCINLDKFIICY